MIPTLIALLLVAASGASLARLLLPGARAGLLAGLSFLLGAGWITVALAVWSLAGLEWSVPLAAALVILPMALWPVARRRARAAASRVEEPSDSDGPARRTLAAAADVLSLATFAGFSVFATLGRMWEWDFWAVWGLKGRVFYDARGFDLQFLRNPLNSFAHPDYPPLLPVTMSFMALVRGGWEDHWVGLLYPAFALAGLLVVRSMLRDESGSSLIVSIATLGFTGFFFSPWVGLAEGPLIALIVAGGLLVRRGVLKEESSSLRAGALVLAVAALTKNEGLAFVIAVTLSLLLTSGRRWRISQAMWPALAAGFGWRLFAGVNRFRSDLTTGSVRERIVDRVIHPGPVLEAISTAPLDKKMFWIGFLVLLLFMSRTILRSERFILLAFVLQLCGAVAAYLATPFDLVWHVGGTWARILNQVGGLLLYISLLALAPLAAELFPKGRGVEMVERPADR